jgi:3-hydroxy-9,10-secoandrosta-1,3,5(10)-triene-9,17-dione monooxygenase
MKEVAIEDDWHVSGLKATGSNSISLKSVFVPEYRALSLRDVFRSRAPGLAANPEALYRAPFRGVFDSAFPPVALGTAFANLDAFRDHTAGRVHAYSGAAFRTSQGHLQCLADATTQLRSALALFRHNIEKLTRAERVSTEMRGSMETQIGYEHAFVIDRCSYAIGRLFRASGGKALYTHNPLQRYFRDVHAITQHAMADLDTVGSRYGAMIVEQAATQPAAARPPTDSWLPIR